ncbi:hypothetical protein A6M27_01350 [Acidithiobacillus thiooxidans]|uniref:Uncharacterized protein n=1 Tax=Acidithiobacillus thiooxidans TaxID=930 RepID=A0A1C2JMS5_ACITH|nr:hypothetical protein A6O24_08525 [Acidithiobacillus thiooxidans]OCX76722.1 hypothetical protein A6P07_02005 [Acidithiobacillus thiooxidans]OCX81186.1 hypothetical protein A6O26_13575 [Acidithiobacillus thiooxidans]OCX89541.1 hypothetical protein A6M27_01350 [Acidithiobacillus thiooxidans]
MKDYPSVAQHKLKFVIAENQEDLFHGRYPESEVGPITDIYFPSRSTVGFGATSFYDQAGLQRGLSHELRGHFSRNPFASDEKKKRCPHPL